MQTCSSARQRILIDPSRIKNRVDPPPQTISSLHRPMQVPPFPFPPNPDLMFPSTAIGRGGNSRRQLPISPNSWNPRVRPLEMVRLRWMLVLPFLGGTTAKSLHSVAQYSSDRLPEDFELNLRGSSALFRSQIVIFCRNSFKGPVPMQAGKAEAGSARHLSQDGI